MISCLRQTTSSKATMSLEASKPLTEWRPNMTSTVVLVLALLCLCPVHCEDECLKSKVHCYECESNKDPTCNDPFNSSLHVNSKKLCDGCCVKVVRERNTPKQNIWRTCTSKIEINLFMVDHVCMEESGGNGHMCFCESEACNGSPPTVRPQASLVRTVILLATLFLSDWSLTAFRVWHSSPFRVSLVLCTVLLCLG